MAGHSKWKNIQHRKGRQDARKGKIFAKLGREIYVAAREGDKDPATNQKLRLAISKAKDENMPNENIERAIQKAAGGGEGESFEHIMYEGYGPGGIAVLIEVLSDNRNRTAADLRYIFSKQGGNLGEAGCVAWMFERKGYFTIPRDSVNIEEEDMVLVALENGAEDFEATESEYVFTSKPDDFEPLKEAFQKESLPIHTQEVTFVPSNKIQIQGEDIAAMLRLIDALEDHDDVQQVYANFDVSEEELAQYIDG